MNKEFTDDVFVIDCWTDTIEKENTLCELIDKIKVFNVPIILCGHYPVKNYIQEKVDYYIFDKNNDLLLEKDYQKYGIDSERWSEFGDYKITNKVKFHHDYAIWLTMKNAFNMAKQLGKKYIHFLEYDNLPDEIQYRQSFLEYIRHNDAVVYEYDENSTKQDNPYCSAYIFSIKTDTAIEMVNLINSKEEFFMNKPNSWQLEKQLYQSISKVTNNTHISKYIDNDNSLNKFAAWNRNGILINNARFQTYLGVDDDNYLYVHFISGFDNKPADKDYLVEIEYNGGNQFYTIKKDQFQIEKLGPYVGNAIVEVSYQGVTNFTEHLDEDIEKYRRMNKVDIKTRIKPQTKTSVNLNFIDGPFIEILNNDNLNYKVEFINLKNNKTIFDINLKSNHWARPNLKYYTQWLLKVTGTDNDYHFEHKFEPKGRRIFINFESSSLGDSIAWIPYVEKFRKDNECVVICTTFHNHLFVSQYPDIQFVAPGNSVNDIYAQFRIGVFYKDDKIDYDCHPTDPKKEPLLKIASDILGLNYVELKPSLLKLGKEVQKRVCIATHSTAQAKYWNNPNGWQEVVDYLNNRGYEVRLMSMEEDGYMGNFNPTGVTLQPKGSIMDVITTIQESELFIGLSSGLSWVSWASNVPTILISGFTDIYTEPFNGINRIINKSVCNSCWNHYEFDKGDWNWCPVFKGTEQQFECTKNITSNDVISQIEKIL
jgi:autotransporter strand-loop-strand O-heptosyltransferase